jgi:hypothetical protein
LQKAGLGEESIQLLLKKSVIDSSVKGDLVDAKEAEDIVEIRMAARGTLDGMTARTRQLLDEWPAGTYDKFQRKVLETTLWDDIFKQADNQDGLVEA